MPATLTALLATALLLQDPQPAATAQDPTGLWLGKLQAAPGVALRLALHVARKDAGFTVTLDSLDQGAKGLQVDEFAVDGTAVRLALTRLGARFTGEFAADGNAIQGTWRQGGSELALRWQRSDSIPELPRPQHPEPPFPYRTEEVAVALPGGQHATPAFTLAGTLSHPDGPGPHPAVVLITGSGPQDRDESLLGHKPFLVIADHLTRHGFAVLRCDDRGVGGSGGVFKGATSMDFAGDVRAMVAMLAQRDDIDPARIGLCGHSEGGLIAPIVAAQDGSGIAFCVLLAGPGVVGHELLLKQRELLLPSVGVTGKDLAASQELHRLLFAATITETDGEARRKRLTAIAEAAFEGMSEAMQQQIGGRETLLAEVLQLDDPWMRSFLAHDPTPFLERLRCPVLALNGGKDLQVDADQNLKAVRAALQRGAHADFHCEVFEQLNHLFQTCKTGAMSEYAQIEETFAPVALEAITDWLLPRFSKAR